MKPCFIIPILPVLIMLTGCAEMNSKFDCPMKAGVNCASLDEVNAKIDRGEIGSSSTKWVSSSDSKDKSLHYGTCFNDSCCVEGSCNQRPLRQGESVQHIWAAPFEDTSGNYHQASDIYTVVSPGHWVGAPPKAVNQEEA